MLETKTISAKITYAVKFQKKPQSTPKDANRCAQGEKKNEYIRKHGRMKNWRDKSWLYLRERFKDFIHHDTTNWIKLQAIEQLDDDEVNRLKKKKYNYLYL